MCVRVRLGALTQAHRQMRASQSLLRPPPSRPGPGVPDFGSRLGAASSRQLRSDGVSAAVTTHLTCANILGQGFDRLSAQFASRCALIHIATEWVIQRVITSWVPRAQNGSPSPAALPRRRRTGAHRLCSRGLAAGQHLADCLRLSPGETARPGATLGRRDPRGGGAQARPAAPAGAGGPARLPAAPRLGQPSRGIRGRSRSAPNS